VLARFVHATKDFTIQTVQKAANLAVQAGSRLYTDSASSYRALKGYVHAFVNHTQKEYARGDVHENRAECLFSLLKPYLRVFRGVSKCNLPGYIGFFQFLRNFRQHNAFEQAELILQAALDPTIASRAKRGEFVACFDHFDLLGSVPLMRYVTVVAIGCRWPDTPWWHAKAQEFVHGPDVVC
jgi:transposase